jgi:predicted ester cyclase
MSTVEEHKTVVHRFVNEFKNGGGSMTPSDNLLASNFVHHFSDPKLPAGREGFKAIASMIFNAFPDVHVTPEFVVVDDDLVVERSNVRATQTGTFQSEPGTGKQVTWTENNIYRVSRGKIVEMWGCGDLLGIMHQIGAITTSSAQMLHL